MGIYLSIFFYIYHCPIDENLATKKFTINTILFRNRDRELFIRIFLRILGFSLLGIRISRYALICIKLEYRISKFYTYTQITLSSI